MLDASSPFPRVLTDEDLQVELSDLDHARVLVRGTVRWTWARHGDGRFAAFFDLEPTPGLSPWQDADSLRVQAARLINVARPEIGTPTCAYETRRLQADLRATWGKLPRASRRAQSREENTE